jgi:hypothetical protein
MNVFSSHPARLWLASAGLLLAMSAAAQPNLAAPGMPRVPATPALPQPPQFDLRQLIDLLQNLEGKPLPFEIEIRLRLRCAGALCREVQIPNTLGVDPSHWEDLVCARRRQACARLGDGNDAAQRCLEALPPPCR